MLVTKRALSTAMVLVLAVAAGPRPALAFQDRAQPGVRIAPRSTEVRGVIKVVDIGKGALTVAVGGGREETGEQTFTLGKNTEIGIGVGNGRRVSFREGKLADLAPGAVVVIQLAADQKTVEFIGAEAPTVRGSIKAVDGGKNTVTVTVRLPRRDEPTEEEKTFLVGKNAEIAVDDGRGKIFSIKETKLVDLPVGALATLKLSVDLKTCQGILVEGTTASGVVKAVAADTKQITLTTRAGRGDVAEEEHTYTVAPETEVMIDDGKGKRFSLKEKPLAELPVGAIAQLRLSPDQKTAVAVRAEGPSVSGPVKAVDAGKSTITLVRRAGRDGTPEEEKTYTVAPDARIFIDGKEGKLADVKVDEKGAPVGLRLSPDQKTVGSITAGTGVRGR